MLFHALGLMSLTRLCDSSVNLAMPPVSLPSTTTWMCGQACALEYHVSYEQLCLDARAHSHFVCVRHAHGRMCTMSDQSSSAPMHCFAVPPPPARPQWQRRGCSAADWQAVQTPCSLVGASR